MFRKPIAIAMLLVSVGSLSGAEVTADLALRTGTNFFAERFLNSFNKAFYLPFTPDAVPHFRDGEVVYYTIEIPGHGFIAVAGDDRCRPVLAYSFRPLATGMEMPEACASWFEGYASQVLQVREMDLDAPEATRALWGKYGREGFIPQRGVMDAGIGPLMACEWGQKYYYNNQCPADPDGPGGHAIAGCVATALAQVLFYYRYPLQGENANGYMSDYGYEYVDYEETTYHWEEMVNIVYGKYNPEVAKLVYHAGVSVEMDYGPNSSGALTMDAGDALRNYFRYSDNLNYISLFDLGYDFKDSVFANLDQHRVMIYRGGGLGSSHSFVCDGYQDTTYLHFNWGWDGNYNGFYTMDNLHPNSYDFTFDQEAVINIYPREDYPGFCQAGSVLEASRGTFTDGSGPEAYENNQACSWLISPAEEGISNIQLWFTGLNTEEGADEVLVYDGVSTDAPLLGQFTGMEVPPVVVSSGNSLLVVFNTDDSIAGQGWQAEYLAYTGPFCSPLYQFNNLSVNYFTDASGPYNYIDLSDCGWLIDPQDDDTDSISSLNLFFYSMDLAQGDTLVVYDGATNESPVIGKYFGSAVPEMIQSSGNKIYLNFVADAAANAEGWAAGYSSNLPAYCLDTAVFNEKTGIIEDGSGLKKYVSNTHCFWLIETENTEMITFEFLEFDLEYGYDQLRFFDASNMSPSPVATYWGHEIPAMLSMETNKVLLLFTSDGSEEFDGWKIKYTALAPGIGEAGLSGQIKVFPNPAGDKIMVDPAPGQWHRVTYELFDAAMRCVKKGVLENTDGRAMEIGLEDLHAGIYFIVFADEDERYLHKLIIY